MLEILKFIFSSPYVWAGTVILIATVGLSFSGILAAYLFWADR